MPKCPKERHHDGPSSPEKASTSRQLIEAISSTDVRPYDVLLGRGKLVHCHRGNVEYRKDIKARSRQYKAKERQTEKEEIALEVIQIVLDRSGRFLRPMQNTNDWEICPPSVVRKKVKQALRDFVKERLFIEANRTRKAGVSRMPQRLVPPQPQSIFTSAAEASAPPMPARSQAALALSQLSRTDELSALLETNRQRTTGTPSLLFAGVTRPADLVADTLLQQQQASNITIPTIHLSPVTQGLMNHLHPRSNVDAMVTILQQQLQLPQPGALSDVPLLQSYVALMRRQQQLQRFPPGPLSHSQLREIEELIRRFRHEGGGS